MPQALAPVDLSGRTPEQSGTLLRNRREPKRARHRQRPCQMPHDPHSRGELHSQVLGLVYLELASMARSAATSPSPCCCSWRWPPDPAGEAATGTGAGGSVQPEPGRQEVVHRDEPPPGLIRDRNGQAPRFTASADRGPGLVLAAVHALGVRGFGDPSTGTFSS